MLVRWEEERTPDIGSSSRSRVASMARTVLISWIPWNTTGFTYDTQNTTKDQRTVHPRHKDTGAIVEVERMDWLTWRNSFGDVPVCLRSARRELTTGCFRTLTFPGNMSVVLQAEAVSRRWVYRTRRTPGWTDSNSIEVGGSTLKRWYSPCSEEGM